ncbi:hypothetical protein KCP71_24270 [Salmonella enterica subsp. enterica]|nr:hypothetical protein KCP71_24270 [Salmonella enterica subsp. enterica]
MRAANRGDFLATGDDALTLNAVMKLFADQRRHHTAETVAQALTIAARPALHRNIARVSIWCRRSYSWQSGRTAAYLPRRRFVVLKMPGRCFPSPRHDISRQ